MLGWKGDNYQVELDLAPLVSGSPLKIRKAFVKFTLYENYVDMSIGKIVYPFGNVSSKASNNISIFQPESFGCDWMINFNGKITNFGWNAYWADMGTDGFAPSDIPSTIGSRVNTTIADLDIGASLRIRHWDKSEKYLDYGMDFEYTINELVELNFQFFDVAIMKSDTLYYKDTNDLNLFFLASYVKGFQLPIVHNVIPYAGYFSKRELETVSGKPGDGAKENNIIVGLNMQPVDNAFIKIEYNLDSTDDGGVLKFNTHKKNLSDALTVQVLYLF